MSSQAGFKITVDLVKSDVAEGAINTARPLTQPSDSPEGGLAVDATQTPEQWRPAPGYEGLYEVSDHGRVRSIERTVEFYHPIGGMRRRSFPPKLLNPDDVHGYRHVRLSGGRHASVHRLVCGAFNGPPAPDAVVRHLNGIRSDNRPSNLAWGTATENNRDTVIHGTNRNIMKTHCPKGHPYDEANTYRPPAGSRVCRPCMQAAAREYNATHPGRWRKYPRNRAGS